MELLKPKQSAKSSTDFDELDFDDEDEETGYETEFVKAVMGHSKQTSAAEREGKRKELNIIDAIAKSGFNEAFSENLATLEQGIKEAEKALGQEEKASVPQMVVTEDMIHKYFLQTKTFDNATLKVLFQTYIERVVVGNTQVKVIFKIAVSDEDAVLKLNIEREVDRTNISA